jgi:hypothetical protein
VRQILEKKGAAAVSEWMLDQKKTFNHGYDNA